MATALSPRRRFALVASLLLATVVVLTVVLLARGGDTEPAVAATVVKDAQFIDVDEPGVLTFENGDCFRDPARNRELGEEVLNTVECPGADNEVFTFLTLREGAWDAARVQREGETGCARGFRQLWGERGSGPAKLDVFPVLPTERSWNESGDRNVMCVVYSHLGEFRVDPITQVVSG